jgi:cobalt-zinc-cadmium efflux system membrane fusion protein
LGALGLCLALAVAFRMGQRAVVPSPDATEVHASPGEEAGHDGHSHEGEGGGHEAHEEGVATFTPGALAKAGIRVETVSIAPLRTRLQVTGVVEPNLSGVVQVTPRVAGKVTSLRATIGDRVGVGQVLATMTSTELAAAQAQFRSCSARVSAAAANLRRQRQLAGFGEFGQHKVQEARGNFNAAQGDLHEVQAELSAVRNEIAEAEAAVTAARSEEASARSDVVAAETAVAQARTQIDVTQSRFQRQETLLKEELTSRQEWEQARADLQKAQADLTAASASVRSAEARVEAAQAKIRQSQAVVATHNSRLRQAEAKRVAAFERLTIAAEALRREEQIYKSGVFASKEVADAEAALRHAKIDLAAAADAVRLVGGTFARGNTLAVIAPLSGRVTQRQVTIGETVTPEKTLFTIVNLQTVWVQLNVYPRDLSAVRPGLPVTVRTDAVPGKEFRGSVTYVGDAVDETTRTVRVRCVIPNPGGLLKPEMFVRGAILTGVRGQGIAVPREAVQTFAGRSVVYVPGDRPGEFRPREVQTGAFPGLNPGAVEGRILIISGLTPGTKVVTRGAFVVKAQAMKGELGHSHAH